MYWPIGAPCVYDQAIPLSPDAFSQDGLESPTDLIATDLRNDPQSRPFSSGEEGQDLEPHAVETILSSNGQAQDQMRWEDSHDTPEKSRERRRTVTDNGEIIGMQCSRTGHLIVTVTRTSVTVWQSKVHDFHKP